VNWPTIETALSKEVIVGAILNSCSDSVVMCTTIETKIIRKPLQTSYFTAVPIV
jgi:hypothetical protein